MNLSSIVNNNDHLLEKKEVKLTLLLYEDYVCEYYSKAFVELKALLAKDDPSTNIANRDDCKGFIIHIGSIK